MFRFGMRLSVFTPVLCTPKLGDDFEIVWTEMDWLSPYAPGGNPGASQHQRSICTP